MGTTGKRTIFSIQTVSGKSIKEHSYFKHENEILLPPGRHFEVIDKMNSGGGLHIIHLREISPPYQMLADPFDLSQLKKVLPEPEPVLSWKAIDQTTAKPSKPEAPKQMMPKTSKFTFLNKKSISFRNYCSVTCLMLEKLPEI